MAIYGIGAYYNQDVSSSFIRHNIIGTGWDNNTAPELHQYFRTLKVGDIIYIKAASFGSSITVKGIGIISDDKILNSNHNKLTEIGRNVKWLNTSSFVLSRPNEKNNVRSNTIYEELHEDIQKEIIKRL